MNAIVEPFFTCLAASMIWAPIVFLAASRVYKNDDAAPADKVWPAALFIAALPALLAPAAAGLGFSLRAQPPLPPMAELPVTADYAAALAAAPATAAPSAVDLAAMLQAGAALYVYGFLLFLALGLIRLLGFSYRVRYAVDVDEPRLEAGLEAWRRRMGLKRPPRYAFTDAVSSVCVHGFFRPVILMPMSLLDRVSVDDAVLMGAHEMAHIRRGDTWLFVFTKIVKAIFWFNPFIHRISAQAHLAAEQAADALVIARGVDRRQYAKCFVEGLRFAAGLSANQRALVPSFTPFDKRSRRERLDAILSHAGKTPLLSLANKIGFALSIIAASGLAFAQAAFAVAPKPPAEALPQKPVEGEITFGYGEKSNKLGPDRLAHEGVDIKAARGAPVRAAGAGKVIDATGRYKGSKALGNIVVIDHGHGLVTRYAHLDSFIVKKGDAVKAGDIIGSVGSTGVVTGPHLHFEVLLDGVNIDPTPVAAPTPTLAPLPAMKSSGAVTVAPAPTIAAAPAIEPSPRIATESTIPAAPEPPVEPTLSERINKKLANRLDKLDVRLADVLEDFDGFEGIVVDIDDIDFDALAEARIYALNDLDSVSAGDIKVLSEEDLEKIRDARREAIESARQAVRQARLSMERTQIDAARRRELAERRAEEAGERARERAQEQAELQRERAERQKERAERQRERAERQRERARELAHERAQALVERAAEKAGHDHDYDYDYDYDYDFDGVGAAARDREDVLAEHEKALREAKAQLERQIAEIERQRDELKQRKDGKK